MTQPPPKRRPSVGGVRIPSKAPPADAPPSEREFQLLLEIRDALAARLDDHEGRLNEHEQRLLAVRKGQLDAEEQLSDVSRDVKRTLAEVVAMRGTDLDHEQRIARVEELARASGRVAGQDAGSKAGAMTALKVTPVIAAVIAALWEVIVAWWRSGK